MLTKEELSAKVGRVVTDREYNAYVAMERAVDEYVCASLSATLNANIIIQDDNTVIVDGIVMDRASFNDWLILKGKEKGLLNDEIASKLGVDIPDLDDYEEAKKEEEKKEKESRSKYDYNTNGEA